MKRHAGLTLIELLVVLVLALILLGVAAPAFQQSLQRIRLQAATNDLLAAIDLTRSQALARGAKVLMAPLDPAGLSKFLMRRMAGLCLKQLLLDLLVLPKPHLNMKYCLQFYL